MADLAMPARLDALPPTRRLIAVGLVRRHGGRILTLRATEAGVTGTSRPAGVNQ
ncbi:hypothetical protein RKE29_02145 [Streptomyces sp. B1866]|uniref:hypothetical protein n=1 Tax=Streptomyces sp. B1866 TaxID=3075431 RepID=UPI00288CC0F5|nr:hypothetical protein [Streptomyces sp. B1866]MDT3395462.1 hypothetical protein [Streptomyces sp. B1866]